MVEAAAEAQGFKVQVRPLAYDDRLAQVHGRPRHVRYLARRDEARVRRRVVRGVYLYELLLHRAAVVAGEVEICVVREVAERISIRKGAVAYLQRVLLELIEHIDL